MPEAWVQYGALGLLGFVVIVHMGTLVKEFRAEQRETRRQFATEQQESREQFSKTLNLIAERNDRLLERMDRLTEKLP